MSLALDSHDAAVIPVVGYVRVSQVRGREGDSFISPELQREQIAAVARREGLEVVEVIEELDASGGDAKRPGWNQAIEMVESGRVGGIAVWNLSRFSRSVKDALVAMERVEGAGGRVYSATEDTGNRMLRTILLAVAENERDRAADGFRVAKASAIERGIHMRVPLGYIRTPERRLVPDPGTAPVVQGAFERKARGDSVESIVRWMRGEGVEFTATGVRYMLSNRAYRGEAHAGDLVNESAHEALVTEAQFRRAQGKGAQSQRTGRLAGKFLLGGFARCANCGSGLRLSTGGRKGRPFYYCRHHACGERG
jgi:site-specific DNA recombinase